MSPLQTTKYESHLHRRTVGPRSQYWSNRSRGLLVCRWTERHSFPRLAFFFFLTFPLQSILSSPRTRFYLLTQSPTLLSDSSVKILLVNTSLRDLPPQLVQRGRPTDSRRTGKKRPSVPSTSRGTSSWTRETTFHGPRSSGTSPVRRRRVPPKTKVDWTTSRTRSEDD